MGRGRRASRELRSESLGVRDAGLGPHLFLRFADAKFKAASASIEAKGSARRKIGPSDYHAQRVIYLTEAARFDYLLNLPEGADLGRAVTNAMRDVEDVVKPQNADGFVNWLTTHLSNALGQVAVMRTRARIEAVGGVGICRVDVAASSAPVTARMSDKAEVFWVRMNNSTRALSEIEIEDYIRDRW